MLVLLIAGILFLKLAPVILPALRRILIIKTDLDNIRGPEPASFLKGNLGRFFDPHSGWSFIEKLSEQFGRIVRIHGAFGSRHLYIYDAKAIYNIIVKDQDIFLESPAFYAHNSLAFGGGLLSCHGETHKKQRKMLNPVFSPAHLRNLVSIFHDVARKIETTIKLQLLHGPQEIDVLHWTSRGALETIGKSGFGCSFDTLGVSSRPHPFVKAAKEFSPAADDLLFLREYFLPMLVKIGSPEFRRFIVDHFPWGKLRRFRDIVDTMDDFTRHIFDEKKKALVDDDLSHAKQNDLMGILNLVCSAIGIPRATHTDLFGTIAFAGTDTTSNVISRTLDVLSRNPTIQDDLRNEVTLALRNYEDLNIPYDELMSLPLLDAVCRETLRLYPPLMYVTRVATEDYMLPLSASISGWEGQSMDSILIPRNTKVFVSIYDINRDPDLWGSDSFEWKPARWLSRLPQKVYDAHIPGVYSHMLTFLGGARGCIGFKFAELEMSTYFFMDKEVNTHFSTYRSYVGLANPQLPFFSFRTRNNLGNDWNYNTNCERFAWKASIANDGTVNII